MNFRVGLVGRGGAGVVSELEGLDRKEHAAVSAGDGLGSVPDHHEGDEVMGKGEANLPVDGGLAQPDGDRDKEALGPIGTRGAPCEVGVEFADVVRVGQGVAGTEGEDRQGGGLQNILCEGVGAGGAERTPATGVQKDGLTYY